MPSFRERHHPTSNCGVVAKEIALSEESETLPESLRGQCSAPLGELPPEKIRELLLQAAQVRFHGKAAQFQARARHVGWEQTLWEGIFRALGYK